MLAMAVVRQAPQMEVIAFNFSTDSRQIVLENIAEAQFAERIRCETGDMHAMPFEDGYT